MIIIFFSIFWYVFTNLVKKLNKSRSPIQILTYIFIIVAYYYWEIMPGLHLTMVRKLGCPKANQNTRQLRVHPARLLLHDAYICKCEETTFLARYFSVFLKLLVCGIHFENSRDAHNIFCKEPEKTNFRHCGIYDLHGKQLLKSLIVAWNKSSSK